MATPLFVYGTLKRDGPLGSKSPLRDSKLLSSASVAGTLYDLGEYPGVVRDSGAQRVFGELYELDDENAPAILRRLDRYEGREFVRQRGFATLKDGTRRLAWFYVLRALPESARKIRSGRYRR